MIKDSERKTFKSSFESMVRVLEVDMTNLGGFESVYYTYQDGVLKLENQNGIVKNKFVQEGPDISGKGIFYADGQNEKLSILYNGKYCSYLDSNHETVVEATKSEEECLKKAGLYSLAKKDEILPELIDEINFIKALESELSKMQDSLQWLGNYITEYNNYSKSEDLTNVYSKQDAYVLTYNEASYDGSSLFSNNAHTDKYIKDNISLNALGLYNRNITDGEVYLDKVDDAIDILSKNKAILGADQNKLELMISFYEATIVSDKIEEYKKTLVRIEELLICDINGQCHKDKRSIALEINALIDAIDEFAELLGRNDLTSTVNKIAKIDENNVTNTAVNSNIVSIKKLLNKLAN